MLDLITPLILTRDEAPNIERTLRQLDWARDVIVVDSYSRDATLEIAGRFPNVRVFRREIDTLAGQSNYGLAQAGTRWVLLLDADYFVPADLVAELARLGPPAGVHAYRAAFTYAVGGRPLRASLYPPRVVLLDRVHARVWQDGHAHRVVVDGAIGDLAARIVHDDRKSFADFVRRQRRYMGQEAEKIRRPESRPGSFSTRLRRLIVVAPPAVLLYTLIVKGLILDGAAGLRYAGERFVAEAILSWELIRRTFRGARSSSPP